HARMNEIIPHALQTFATSFTFTPTCTDVGGVVTCLPVTVPAPSGIFTNVNSQNVGFSSGQKAVEGVDVPVGPQIVGASNCPTEGLCNLETIFPHGTQAG